MPEPYIATTRSHETVSEQVEQSDSLTVIQNKAPDRVCAVCGDRKPETAFPSTGRGRRRPACRDCHNGKRRASGWESRRRAAEKLAGETRWRALRERTGITREQYEALAASQGQACAMCKKVPKSVRPLVVDHCHETGKVRALLCVYCNVVVGMYENHGQVAAEYLAVYGAGSPILQLADAVVETQLKAVLR